MNYWVKLGDEEDTSITCRETDNIDYLRKLIKITFPNTFANTEANKIVIKNQSGEVLTAKTVIKQVAAADSNETFFFVDFPRAPDSTIQDGRLYRYQVQTVLSIITSFAYLIDICEKCDYPAVPSSFLSSYISPSSRTSSNYIFNHGQQSVSSASTARSTTSNTSRSIKMSDFRLWMVLHTPSKFNLCDWLINDESLETYIIDKLFEGNKNKFDQIITDYTNFLNIIRKAFYYYYNRNNGARSLSEMDFQYVFILLLNSLINNTDIKAKVVEANNIKLETTIQASDNNTNTQYSEKRLDGFGDIIGIPDDLNNIVDDDIENNNFYYHSIFNGELKKPADSMMRSACYKEKDQLLGEIKAIGDLKRYYRGIILTKSLLTDLFSLVICFRVSDNYFISSRVTDPKQYLVRILFCLCEFDESSLNSFITVENTLQKSDEDIVNETKDESIPENFNNGNISSRSNNDQNISERNINHQHADHDNYKKSSNLDSSLNMDVDENAPFVHPNILRKYVDYEYLSENLLRLHNRNQNFP